MTESLVLSLAGGVLGLAVAAAMMNGLARLALPFGFAIADLDLRLDGGVLAFTLAISLVAGLLFGVAPAARGASTAPARVLREARGGGGRGRPASRPCSWGCRWRSRWCCSPAPASS